MPSTSKPPAVPRLSLAQPLLLAQLWAAGAAFAAPAAPALPASPFAVAAVPAAEGCRTHVTAWDRREVRCEVAPDGTARRVTFSARFAGVHDDTELSMAMLLDGQPMTCTPGSLLETQGGDSDIALTCHMELAPDAAAGATTARQLVARIRFRCAEFLGTGLDAAE